MSNANENQGLAKVMDTLLLGGASIIVWMVFRLIELDKKEILILALGMMFLANFVNHPHFVHSYQMFFEIWPEIKLDKKSARYKARWLVTAIFIPLFLAVCLAFSVYFSIHGDFRPMQVCLGTYAVLVGWHYVKQSFGMALFDAARSKVYWSAYSRKVLLWNSYISWIAALMISASVFAGGEFWGVKFPTLGLFDGYWTAAAAAVAAISAAWTLFVLWRQIQSWRKSGIVILKMPLAGMIGYLIGIYLWTLLAWLDYKFILVIPFFHSLQYLVIVSKYQKGRNKINLGVSRILSADVLNYARAIIIGAVAFWVVPGLLDYLDGRGVNFLSSGVFIFTAAIWIFINIHHYFIDSVIWKKENPLMEKYLFS